MQGNDTSLIFSLRNIEHIKNYTKVILQIHLALLNGIMRQWQV